MGWWLLWTLVTLALGACQGATKSEPSAEGAQFDERADNARTAGADATTTAASTVAIHVASGGRHSCAIDAYNQVFCWGDNTFGQLGDGTTTQRRNPVPVRVAPGGLRFTRAVALALGNQHSCALTALTNEWKVFCWGRNVRGQLGDGTKIDRTTPVAVRAVQDGAALAGVRTLTAGIEHTCALLNNGEARCWGANFFGQLGDGKKVDRTTPVAVREAPEGDPLTGVEVLAAGGYHGCAQLAGGEARCWGRNADGQVGDGTQAERLTPVAVREAPEGAPLTGVRALSLGAYHSCAQVGFEARCWGNNGSGRLGDGTITPRLTPVAVGGTLTSLNELAMGYEHSCAVVNVVDGQARCWGFNPDGRVGDGSISPRATPVAVRESVAGPPLGKVQALAPGGYHTCALLTGGEIRCWGSNGSGQLGDGTTMDRVTPTTVQFLPSAEPALLVSQLAAGIGHNCAIVEGGSVRCWGFNDFGQLGDGTTITRPTPTPVRLAPGGDFLTGARALALGGFHSCALLDGGEVRCWGRNQFRQLGDGTAASVRLNPVSVVVLPGGLPLTGVQSLAAGYEHSCVQTAEGGALCWGDNHGGQLGNNWLPNGGTPAPVMASPRPSSTPLTGVRALALGLLHSCAMVDGGGVKCWGENINGELGDGTTDRRAYASPVLVAPNGSPLVGARGLAVGSAVSCVRTAGDEAHCWGAWLGTDFGTRPTPTPIQASPGGEPLTGVQALALGGSHGCALVSGGEAHCWGDNNQGQLGNPMAARITPSPVVVSPGGPPLTGVEALSLGTAHSCARVGGGEVRCWGNNSYGQLGDDTTILRSTPVTVLTAW